MSKRRFACFDIDATLHRGTREGESLGECVVYECVRRGLVPADALAVHAPLREAYEKRHSSYSEYNANLCRHLEESFYTGLKATDVCALAAEIAERERDRTYVFTRELLRAVQKLGYYTVAISGSFHGVSEPFAKSWGFDRAFGSELHVDENGKYYGTPDRMVVHARDKGEVVRRLVEREKLTRKGSIAVGDAMSDASMLEAVDHPIMFNPDEKLLKHFQLWKRQSYLVLERRVIYQTRIGDPDAHCNGFLPGEVANLIWEAFHKAGVFTLNI